MIASLRGNITTKTDKYLILEVANVGYRVAVLPEVLNVEENTELYLYIHSHIREDAFDLYGFVDYSEMEFFEMLLGVSGIGPKGAMTILSVASIPTLKRAIKTSDLGYLNKISGIGKKTAEKMVIELRDKIGIVETGSNMKDELDALEALKSLGYSQNEARDAMKEISPDTDTNTKVREALKILGKK